MSEIGMLLLPEIHNSNSSSNEFNVVNNVGRYECSIKSELGKKKRIQLSNAAALQVLFLMFSKYENYLVLRISVRKESGCAGIKYAMTVDSAIKSTDEPMPLLIEGIDCNGVVNKKVLVADKQALLYIIGSTIDYQDDEEGKRFVFINPRAEYTCGCGSSFSPKGY